MKTPQKILSILASSAVLMAVNPIWAAGTTAGTDVDNRATISYSVGGVSQANINSSSSGNNDPSACIAAGDCQTTFKVDRKIDLNVSSKDSDYVTIGAGYDNDQAATIGYKALKFEVTNESNAVIDILLKPVDSTAKPTGFSSGSDNFNGTDYKLYLDDGNGVWDAADTLITKLTDMAVDAAGKKTVFVVADIAAYPTRVNGDIASITLVAQAAEATSTPTVGGNIISNDDNGHTSPGGTASTTADSATTVQDVFADAAGQNAEDIGYNFVTGSASAVQDAQYNGQHSDTSAFKVLAAQLTVTKTSTVISDPVNGVSANAKRIPGAIIQYEIKVENANGSSTATGLNISDSLAAEITAGTLAYTPGSIEVSTDGGTTWVGMTDALGGDDADWNVTAANTVSVLNQSVAGNADIRVRFQAEVQ
jgi:hypothetical protein